MSRNSKAACVIGIDAGNTRAGGGLTYLTEMLGAADPAASGVFSVVVWGNAYALGRMPARAWLRLRHETAYDGPFYRGFAWQRRKLGGAARTEGCKILFFPGSAYLGNFHPYVALSQNMLPFEPAERKRYGLSWMRLRLKMLEYLQRRTFRHADGMIFLTHWAKDAIERRVETKYPRTRVISHGISQRFRGPIQPQAPVAAFSAEKPFRWLYVSIVDVYKHQWRVAEAVAKLHARGAPITVDFVGPAYGPAFRRLQKSFQQLDPEGKFLRYLGPVGYDGLAKHYKDANGFIFASSCENLPNILIEAMSAACPIACSERGPMPEVLNSAGVYFNPEQVDSIASAMDRLLRDEELRAWCASRASERATAFSWERCARETFDFLAEVAGTHVDTKSSCVA